MANFGEKMRALMAERQISQRRLARLVPCDNGHLSKIVNGRKNPSADLAERLDDVLDAGGELVALRSAGSFRRTLTSEDDERLALVSERPARLDAAALDALAVVLAGQRRLEDAVGSAMLLGPVAGQLDVITAMLRGASGPLRDRLGRIVAEWAVFAGWLHAAVRQDARALELFGRGEELADDFGDGTVAAIATSFRGYVARRQDRPRAVVRASMAALATPGGHPAQRTFDRLQAAQGLAALGEADRARRLLDEAAGEASDGVEPPPPVYWYSEPFFQLNIGMVHRDLGEHADAVALLGAGLEGMPVNQTDAEWLGEYRAVYEDVRERC